MSLKNCLIVLWVYIMYVLGIWLFLSGYLLKRIVIHQNSTSVVNIGSSISCQDISSLQTVSDEFIKAINVSGEHVKKKNLLKRFKKVIIVIIDALRYDFTERSLVKIKSNAFHLNKMPVFEKLVKKYPNNAVLLPLYADPPTTTLQRLKGITTGSLPTFIDISFNFHSFEIKEDSLIWQMNRLNKNIVFMGDDTWDSIFPKQFTRSFSYPSFNVKDLHTVDNGILDHIYEELNRNSTDVLIAHFLGVDHCGHRYGPKHPEMSRKLKQMNNVIQKISEMLKGDTVLFVMGDHGMTDSGDHGGDSMKEIMTALFLYSPTKFVFDKSVHSLPAISQIDIVPTLSLLTGLPIPFSNLGSVISQLFTLSLKRCFQDDLDALVGGALAMAENALQVHRYLKAYTTVSHEFDNSFVTTFEEKLKNTSLLWKNISSDVNYNREILSKIISNYKEYLFKVRSICEKKWAKFNFEHMVIGLSIIGFTLLYNLWVAEKINSKCFIIVPATVLFITLHATLYIFCSFHVWFPVAFFISCLFIKFLKLFYDDIVEYFFNLFNVPTLFLIVLFLCCFSNSFIIYEDHVILYLLQSIIVYRFHPCLINTLGHIFPIAKGKLSKRNQKVNFIELLLFVCLMICIRMGSIFFKCREEQIPCENTNFILSLEKLHMPQSYKIFRLFISLASIVVPAILFLCFSSFKDSNKARTATAVNIRYGIFFVCVFTSLRWWLNIVSAEAVERILKGNEVVLTRSASLLSLIMCLAIFLFPILSEIPWTVPSKEIYSESLGTFLFIISQLLSMVAGDALSFSIMLMNSSILLYVIMSDFSTNFPATQGWIDILIWNLMTRHWFFASAHQATFTSIQWDAAFLYHHKEVYSYAVSGALVVINTFSSNILIGLAFPVILIWSQSTACSSISIFRLHMKYLFCFGVKLLGHALAAVILRRHLMVWKIFLPRLLYEVLGIITTMVSASISHYFIVTVISQYHRSIRKNLSYMFSEKDQ